MSVKIDKVELAQKINALEGLDNETKAQLLELLHDRKKYGLVWEDKPEDVEERLREELPVLVEDKSKAIISDDKDAPNHILIEGDNLEALTSLSYTHEGKIDVIYIDPPYNTGSEDFLYNDNYVDTSDEFRHSKWLSFMAKRLKIAKRLLSDKGIIFISIDDNECANLKILCDEIFGHFINSITVKTSETSGVKMSHTEKKLPKIKEYLLIYSKSDINLCPVTINKSDDLDKIKNYAKYYSKIILNPNDEPHNWSIIPIKDYLKNIGYSLKDDDVLRFKIEHAKQMVYRTNNKSFAELKFNTEIERVTSSTGIEYIWWEGKQMLFLSDYIEEGLCDLWTDISTINLNKEVCGLPAFKGGQKPMDLLQRVLLLHPSKDLTILDFFAGSGTTMHAVLKQNAIDKQKRKVILIQKPELVYKIINGAKHPIKNYEDYFKLGFNTITDITYERNKRVINGYTTPKGETVEGLHKNTLRYYRTGFVARESSATAKRELMYASADMLCIKNDIYTEQKQFGALRLRKDVARYFADGDKRMLVIYNPDAIETIVAELKMLEVKTPIITYIFSLNDYAMNADFEEVTNKVKLCALPAAILNAYYKVLPKRKRKENIL